MSDELGSVVVAAPARPRRFFGRREYLVFGLTTAVAFVCYLLTLAPGLTPGDSGELITAGYRFGVPRAPGYPVWTMLAFVWSHVVVLSNVAWRFNLLSAVSGAVAAGLVALLISRSGRELVGEVKFLQESAGATANRWLVSASAVAAGLLLAFSPALWSQSVTTTVVGVSAVCLLATLVALYRWSFTPEKRGWLYFAAFLWGVSLATHQTLVLLMVALPAFVWLTERKLGRDLLVPVLAVILLGALGNLLRARDAFSGGLGVVLGGGAATWLYFLWREGPGLFSERRTVVWLALAVLAGLMVFAYLPVASGTNPPIDAGRTRTLNGFLQHISHGQYARVPAGRPLWALWGQLNLFVGDVLEQFSVGLALVVLVTVFFYNELALRKRNWLKFLTIAFVCFAVGFLLIANPTRDKQKQDADSLFFLSGYCLYALWIGYGLILGLGYVVSKRQLPPAAVRVIAVLVCLVPLWPLSRNWASVNQRGHNFGGRFAALLFTPGGGYSELERGGVLFADSESGRAAAEFMVYVESHAPVWAREISNAPEFDRHDVTLIVPSTLTDHHYLQSLQDRYGIERAESLPPLQRRLGREHAYPVTPLWLPGPADEQLAFRQYLADVQSRTPGLGEEAHVEGGGQLIAGPVAVAAINHTLARMVFEHNREQHTFYVDDNFVAPWMYPFLEPHGIIFKLNAEELPQLEAEVIARDRAYWDALAHTLLADPKFQRDARAQQEFALRRAAIGGLYANRKLFPEAEYALRQAVALAPNNAEAQFRLAQVYADQDQFNMALEVLSAYQPRDPYNVKLRDGLRVFQALKQQAAEIVQLEQLVAAQPDNLALALQLVRAYALRRRFEPLDRLIRQLLARPDLTSGDFLQLGQAYADLNEYDRARQVLGLLTRRHPQQALGWYALAVVESARRDCAGCVAALRRALGLDADGQIRTSAQNDPRFSNCRADAAFRNLLPPLPAPFTVPGAAPEP